MVDKNLPKFRKRSRSPRIYIYRLYDPSKDNYIVPATLDENWTDLILLRNGKRIQVKRLYPSREGICASIRRELEVIHLMVLDQDNNITQFKIRKNTPLQNLMNFYCDKFGLARAAVHFQFKGQAINYADAPMTLEMKEGDVIRVFIEKPDGHVEKTDGHVEKTGGHVEKTGGHVEKTDGHVEKTDGHVEKTDGHVEKTDSHEV